MANKRKAAKPSHAEKAKPKNAKQDKLSKKDLGKASDGILIHQPP